MLHPAFLWDENMDPSRSMPMEHLPSPWHRRIWHRYSRPVEPDFKRMILKCTPQQEETWNTEVCQKITGTNPSAGSIWMAKSSFTKPKRPSKTLDRGKYARSSSCSKQQEDENMQNPTYKDWQESDKTFGSISSDPLGLFFMIRLWDPKFSWYHNGNHS